MRVPVAQLAFGLLAWLPACRNQAFESCSRETNAGCVEQTTDGSIAPTANDAGNETAPATPLPSVTPSTSQVPTPSGSTAASPNAADAGPDETRVVPSERDGDDGETTTTLPTKPSPAPANSDPSKPAGATTDISETSAPGLPDPEYTYGHSLITNGDFADGSEFWSIERISGGGLTPELEDGTLCVTSRSGTHVVVGWPAKEADSLALPPGRYQFSFRARGRGVHLWAKVGHAYEPYDILFEREWTAEEVGWHDIVHEFDFEGDDAAGVAFNIDLTPTADTLCFDEVALRRAVGGDASAP
jgi:hypothetical protein